MAALPDNLSYTKIVGRFLRAITDTTDDPDKYPDGVPMEGLLITFTPDLDPARVRTPTSVPPTTIVIAPIVVTTNDNGDVMSPDGSLGVYLVASDDPDIVPSGWTYRCSIEGPNFASTQFSFIAAGGTELDLTTLVPVPANPGAEILLWQSVVAQAEAAAADAAQSAAEAAAAAAEVEGITDDIAVAEAAATAAAASAAAAAASAADADADADAAGVAADAADAAMIAAGNSATAAAGSAAAAATSATNAAASEVAAETAQTAAEAAQAAAEAAAGGAGGVEYPTGGSDGMVLRKASVHTSGGGALWGANLAAPQPTCWIQLGGDPAQQGFWWSETIVADWENFPYPEGVDTAPEITAYRESIINSMMPPLYIYEGITGITDGTGVVLFGTAWRESDGSWSNDWSNSAPATFQIYIEPRFDGEEFFVELPLDFYRNSPAPWSHLDLNIQNNNNLGYKANVRLLFLSGTYAGTRVAPGVWYDDPTRSGDSDYRTLVLEDKEAISWRVSNIGGEWPGGTQITPVIVHGDRNGLVAETGDKFWEKNVKARENCFSFSASGELVASEPDATDGHTFYNDKLEIMGISLIRASVGQAPAGSDIQVDVKIDGVSILTAPLSIPAGATTATATPALSNWPLGATSVADQPSNKIALAKWAPGSKVTAHIIGVGSTYPGRNLTLQIWAG